MRVAILLLVLVVAVAITHAADDYYTLLGLRRDANIKQIRKAFRDLSKKWHPDKNPNNPDAESKYQQINNAYSVLSDEEKRRVYDQYGEEGLKQNQQGGGHDPFDFFGFGRRGNTADNMAQGGNLELPLFVELKDIYLGKEIKILNRRQVLCTHCRGSGAKSADDIQTCKACNGKGIKITTRQLGPGFVQQMQTTCDACNGKGTVAKSKCPHCRGKKVEIGEEKLLVYVEKGMPDKHVIVFSQEADQEPNQIPGDLRLTVLANPHPVFRREGDNLHAEMDITLLEALTGFNKHVEQLDGRMVRVARQAVTIPGHVEVIPGEGMPRHEFPSEKGDLFIKFTVIFPRALTQEQKEGFKKLLSGVI